MNDSSEALPSFGHSPESTEDTIAAISTPPGEGGLAVIRVSGPRAVAIADACFRPGSPGRPLPGVAASHTIHYGHITRDDRIVDEVLLSVFRAPRTFTREDMVEISSHGGRVVAREILEAVIIQGARVAGPGEFTRRAFLNGRIDLVQAEAVSDVIHAQTDRALRLAEGQLAGHLSQRFEALRELLMGALAHVEAHIDFPEEDIAPETGEGLTRRLEEGLREMEALLRTAREGRILRDGLQVAIVGRPNVGKSSLLNRLLGIDRAIVSSTPGTTRDTIEETVDIDGIPVHLVDTAGLRDAVDGVEQEGVRRSRQALERADLRLLVLDASEPLAPVDESHLREWAGRALLVAMNKSDLPRRLHLPETAIGAPVVAVSALTGSGMEELKMAIGRSAMGEQAESGHIEVMINARHQDALRRAREAATRAHRVLAAGSPLELVGFELRSAVHAVGEIVGRTTTEDLLDQVFSRFCIGK